MEDDARGDDDGDALDGVGDGVRDGRDLVERHEGDLVVQVVVPGRHTKEKMATWRGCREAAGARHTGLGGWARCPECPEPPQRLGCGSAGCWGKGLTLCLATSDP